MRSKTLKNALALLAAWGFGLWTGIQYTGSLAPTRYNPAVSPPPEWVTEAKMLSRWTIVMIGLCVGVWILIDWSQRDVTLAEHREDYNETET